jgi:outer membrane lipoprotein-sorting protein
MALQDGSTLSRRARAAARPVLVMLFLAATAAAQQRPARPADAPGASFDELYAKGQQANAAIKTLTARFTETTTSALLTKPLVARGTLSVERPARVVVHYDDPEERIVLIDGDRMTMVWPARHLRTVSNIARTQQRVQKYFAGNTAADLRKEFDVELHAVSERPGTTEVTLLPKRKQIKETLARLDLWVNPASSLLAAMKMTFAGGESKTMEFHDIVPNAVLPPNTFAEPR